MKNAATKQTLRNRRQELGLSSAQLAYRLGRAQSTVIRLEQSEAEGRISIALLVQAARALGCELFYELRPAVKSGKHSPEGTSTIPAGSRNRRVSKVGNVLSRELIDAARKLSQEQRLLRALELSEFSRNLARGASKARR